MSDLKAPEETKQHVYTALAFLAVLIIWSSTPLAISWSSEGAPATSVSLRMLIGTGFCFCFLLLSRQNVPLHRGAVVLYLVGGLSMFVAMSMFYAAAQEIPSGWIAVMFGISPILTGFFSSFIEPESKLTPTRLVGLCLGLGGLYLVFSVGINFADASIAGVLYTLGATVISAASSVTSRYLIRSQSLSGMQLNIGSLLVALPFFTLTMLITEPELQFDFSQRAWAGILYLGFIGTGIGFTLYYFLLKRVSAARISLITLVTPIVALSLGSWLNNEPIVSEVWLGAVLVCCGLVLYEFKPKLGLRRM